MRVRVRALGVCLVGALAGVATSLSVDEASAQGGPGTIVGVVRDSAGMRVNAAEVAVAGTPLRALTSEDGSFRIARVGPGEVTLVVRRLGFRPDTVPVTVPGGREVTVNVLLTPVPAQLAAVRVQSAAQPYDSRLSGFNERRAKGAGTFISRDRLDQVTSYRFTDILREVPGVRIRPLRGGGTTVQIRASNCSPLVFIDGAPASAGAMDLDMIDLFTVEGIEIYHGLARVPAEFASVRGLERCGVIAIWSKPYRPPPRAPRAPKPVDLEALVADRAVFTAEDVDSPASLVEGTLAPAYPDSLWRAGIAGRVTVELIVGVTGRMQSNSLRIVSSTHPLFAASVASAMEDARFEVAAWQGRQVRQIVYLPIAFEIPSPRGGNGTMDQ